MNTRTIVTVMTTALLSASLVSVSSAQDEMDRAQNGIEIITIIGKRPAPAVATACVSQVVSSVDTATDGRNGIDKADEEVLESGRPNMDSSHRPVKHCNEQAVIAEAQI